MFPGGWPGRGLLVLRLTGGSLLLHNGIAYWFGSAHHAAGALGAASLVVGLLTLLGLWTPIAGVLSAIIEAALMIEGADDPRILMCLIGIGLAIAMLGPGGLSIDAAIFGRRCLDLPDR